MVRHPREGGNKRAGNTAGKRLASTPPPGSSRRADADSTDSTLRPAAQAGAKASRAANASRLIAEQDDAGRPLSPGKTAWRSGFKPSANKGSPAGRAEPNTARRHFTQDSGPAGPLQLTRRRFLEMAAGGTALAGMSGLLGACQRPGDTSLVVPLPRPNHQVKWPIYSDNEPIKSGLAPEKGATLQVYNWVDYINEAVLDSFAKKYDCKYNITTFDTMAEGISKLQSGELNFDIFFPTIDFVGPLVEGKLLRPLNHDYIPNIDQAWPHFRNPFYDLDWQYTIPYTIYTTGMGWRKDHTDLTPSWAMPWVAGEAYRGKVGILDDYREGPCLALLKMGITDLNTTDDGQVTAALDQLNTLQGLTDLEIDNNDFSDLPEGQSYIHQAWSGDIGSAWEYLPSHVKADVLGYWFPADGVGPIANDLVTILTTGQNPVLSHLFLNYMLDLKVALVNIGYNGYMQPIEGATATVLIEKGYIPAVLSSTVVKTSYFQTGLQELALPPDANDFWQNAWLTFSGGL
ncbi:MAG: extracellular solute-binding protein [Acidimicrobiales bacterium]